MRNQIKQFESAIPARDNTRNMSVSACLCITTYAKISSPQFTCDFDLSMHVTVASKTPHVLRK